MVCRWFPDLDKLFLAGIAENEVQRAELERVYGTILKADASTVTETLLLQHSMRTYPAILLAGEETIWLGIQKDKESNLALSPEETAVLEGVYDTDGGYPIFINGRAGSGKSTVLYYLFTDYVNLYLEFVAKEDVSFLPPLLLSCSDELRRRAHEAVQKLLSHNPRFRAEENEPPEVPGECFREFRSFLLEFLTEEERSERFPDSKYISYAEFRRFWHERFMRDKRIRAIGADVSWHVIRTYIKGLDSEGYLDPDEYEHLPKKQKSVSLGVYKMVHDSVFETWYKDVCERDGYWDDQDLARFIFDTDRAKPVYPAVFCDEAQDFTRVELDLIFRLCLFTDRELGHEDLPRVPFAFAGDPFQTLNPTGFRWDATQAMFHDKLIDTLGKNVHRSIDLHYRDLSLNYRSTRNIVRLCNLIQALRAALFDLSNLAPQQTWQMEENSPMPVWFDQNKLSDWLQLGQEKDVMTIVPCMLNEEQEYVQNDSLLRQVVQTDEQGIPLNVLSPVRAKGLEFARVALYGFADKLPGDLFHLLERDDLDLETLLPFEYFVNQLYVAASRPKRRLFIIESQKGLEQLWKIANDDTLQQKMWKRLADGKTSWMDNIGGFVPGNSESWNEDRGNPEENAERFRQQGLSNKDPFLLRSAAALYENLGKPALAQLCKGYALSFEDKPIDAGSAFQKAGEIDEALRCFWRAGTGAKQHIVDMHDTFPDIGRTLEYRLMKVYHEPTKQAILQVLREVRDRARESSDLSSRFRTEPTFTFVLRSFETEFVKGDLSPEEISGLLSHMVELKELGLSCSMEFLAELNYRQGNVEEAISLWESAEAAGSSPNYRTAKARQLAKRFEHDQDMPLSAGNAKILLDHLMARNEYQLAAKCAGRHASKEQLINVLDSTPAEYPSWQDLLLVVTEALGKRGEWKALYELAAMSTGSGAKSARKSLIKVIRSKALELGNAVIITCARNAEFSRQTTNDLKNFSTFFRSFLSSPSHWKDILTVQVAGAALERAGRQVDALEFYEIITADNGFPMKDVDFARARWITTKEKQAQRESEGGNEKASERHMSEAGDMRRAYGLRDVKLPDFPEVEEVWTSSRRKHSPTKPEPKAEETQPQPVVSNGSTAEEMVVQPEASDESPEASSTSSMLPVTDSFVKLVFGDLQFQFSKAKRRLNITNASTMQTAQITTDPPQMRSLDFDIARDDRRFVCQAWSCECSFDKAGDVEIAALSFPNSGVELWFRFEGTDNLAEVGQ